MHSISLVDYMIEPLPKQILKWSKYWSLSKEYGGKWFLEPAYSNTMESQNQYDCILNLLHNIQNCNTQVIYRKSFLSIGRKYRRHEFNDAIIDNLINTIRKHDDDPLSAVRVELLCDMPFFWEIQERCGYSSFPNVMHLDLCSLIQDGIIQNDFIVTVYPNIFAKMIEIIVDGNYFQGLKTETIAWNNSFHNNRTIMNEWLQKIQIETHYHLSEESSLFVAT